MTAKATKTEKEAPKSKGGFTSILFLMFYLCILTFTFFKVYKDVFDKKINLGGDNASYYILGNSIATGEGYTDIFKKQGISHKKFPPGYPVIIAAVTKIFSNDILTIKRVNGFFLLLSIGVMFLVLYELTGNFHLPFIACLFSLLNYHLLSYSVIMMSEIPFLFFSTLCLWLFLKTDFTKELKKNWMFFLLIPTIAFTYHIRSTGLALFAGIVLFLIFKRNWKYLITISVGFIAMALPWYLRTKSLGGGVYMNKIMQKNPYRPEMGELEFGDWFTRFWNNLERYITREIPSGTLNFIATPNYKEAVSSTEWVIGLVVLILMLFGLMKVQKYKELIFFYILATFGILLLWPEVWFGIRFLLPLIPLLTFLFINGIVEIIVLSGQKVLKIKNQTGIHIAIVVMSVIGIKSYAEEPIDKLKKQAKGTYVSKFNNYFELAIWVRDNTPKESVTCSRKAELFYLYSNRYTTGYRNTFDKEELVQGLIKAEVDYVVMEQLGYSSTGRYLYPAINRYPEKFKIIKHLKNPDTYLMEFLPELGYWGEWKDDKKNGHGTYAWANGQKFDGMWKNGVRNGEGILHFQNGQQMEATWTNDKLNGEVLIRSKEGKIVERSIFKDNKKLRYFKTIDR
ncbi:MAG: hypothetical protein COB85_04530 [Bacteroidetes bacterium]|nr:MAG: hypothetical protein COB85_04530 [Bacteroidota bacterium]